jgi:hypothetical protein
MTKVEAISTWKEQCTVRVVRKKTVLNPPIYEMNVLGHDKIREIKIMKGEKWYWISVNYVQKDLVVEYIPCNDTFELTENEYKELEELIGLKF